MLALGEIYLLIISGEAEYFMTVLVHSGCYNKNLIDWAAYKQQKFISQSFGDWKCKDYRQIWYLVRLHFLVHRHCLFTVTSHDRRG